MAPSSLTLPLLLLLMLLPSPSASASFSLATASSNASLPTLSESEGDPEPELAREHTFLEEVIDSVSEKYDWDPDAEVRVWPLDADTARVGAVQRYEFRARAGSASALVRLADESVEWRRPAAPAVEEVDGPGGLDIVPGDGVMGFHPGVRDVDLVGPVEVRVASDGDGGSIELQLPSRNATYAGLKRLHVAAGVALKVVGARKVSFTHPHSIGLLTNGSLSSNNDLSRIWPLSYATCAPILQVSVVGSVLVVVNESSLLGAQVKTLLRSHGTMELLPEKCGVNVPNRLISACVFCSISSRLPRLDKILKTWFSKKNEDNKSMRFIQAKVTSIPLIKFRLELERDITEEDGLWENISEWKTVPMVQRVTLDVVARVEEGRLKAMSVKKVKRPFPIVDASSWSSLTSNISFTKFMSFVLPPEPLTLDVKW
ncbi:uncharacterized protein LOC102700979 [Oryza brachyantha]|uniref:Uncharacterized protein n=1 Tax=Oryza brachyantha TaxID=4533 RepID=J3LT51_ORYBR|nr:uncharacterized protein LOC102700979 [Oryza brachyantha]